MEIKNTRVYGLEETALASGLPMRIEEYDENTFAQEAAALFTGDKNEGFKRLKKLAKPPTIEGHACALKGIIVQTDITAPQYFWLQFERYHFQDTISSQSTMHRITSMGLEQQMNEYVMPEAIDLLQTLVDLYNNFDDVDDINRILADKYCYTKKLKDKKEFFQVVVSNIPEGIQLTRRVNLNYLQLINMYRQRKNHKLMEWKEVFCPWVRTLPEFDYIFGLKEEE